MKLSIPYGIAVTLLTAGILLSCRGGTGNQASQDAGTGQPVARTPVQAIYTEQDQELLEQFLEQLAPYSKETTGELVVRTGKLFLGTPYVAHTLEREKEELVVNLRELDCTTFAENCLAIARTVRGDSPSFERFLEELQLVRYRDGKLDGYPSRPHYFCDWIHNNAQKGLITEPASSLEGEPVTKEINFMSTHPGEYMQLAGDPGLVDILREQEGVINQRKMYYIPEERVEEVEDRLEEGDIVGIATDIEGLAVMHVGILVRTGERIHLMHASSAAGKVVISEGTLYDYLKQSQRATGIMVARPI